MLSGHLQEKSGKYYAVLNCKHRNGKRFPKWVSTDIPVKKGNKRQAERYLDELKNTYNIYGELIDGKLDSASTASSESSGEVKTEKGILFADYMLDWLANIEFDVDPVTYAGYCSSVEDVIVPYFRATGISLQDLTSKDLKDFYLHERKGNAETGKKPKKGTTVVRYHANIHKALETAVSDGEVTRNMAHKMRPSTERFVGNFYQADEALEVIKVAEGTKLELAVIFGFFYGMRRSEIIGLKWQNFDFSNDVFTVAHSVTSVRKNGKSTCYAKDKTKNQSSMRSYPLVPFVKEKLLKIREQQKEDRKAFADYYSKKYLEYVYVDEIGERIKPNYVTNSFSRLLEKNGFRHIRFHDTRHSCASLMLKSKVSMKEIQAWLGHSDYGTTANLYTHLDVDTSKVNSAQRLSSGIFGDTDTTTLSQQP